MAQSRYYSATAQPTVLTASVTPTTTIVQLQQTVGFPVNVPFILALDYGNPSEEVVLCTALAGTNATVTRGYDGTSATSHNAGAPVRHTWTALDGNDSRAHEGSTSGVHGVTGNVVGTTDTQTLTNKTLNNPVINSPSFTGTVNIANPNITGTVTGGATYSSPVITGATVNTSTLNSPTISGTVLGNASYSNITCITPSASITPLLVAGQPSQTNPLQIWQDSTPATVARVRPDGTLSSNAGLQAGSGNQFQVNSSGNITTVGTLTLGTTGQFTISNTGKPRSTTFTSSFTENNTSVNTGSTTYVDTSTVVQTTIVVPPSGKVHIMGRVEQFNNTNSVNTYSVLNVTGSVSGSLRASTDANALIFSQNNAGNNQRSPATDSIIISSSNPGETLTIKWQHRVDAGSTGAFDYRSITAIPLMG